MSDDELREVAAELANARRRHAFCLRSADLLAARAAEITEQAVGAYVAAGAWAGTIEMLLRIVGRADGARRSAA